MNRLRLAVLVLGFLVLSAGRIAAQDVVWTTYRNDAVGYSIMVPADWRTIVTRPRSDGGFTWAADVLSAGEEHKVTFLEASGEAVWKGALSLRVFSSPAGMSVREWLERTDWGDEPRVIQEESGSTGPTGPSEAVAWTQGQIESRLHGVTLSDGKRFFEITFELAEGIAPSLDLHRQIYERMVGGFRLIRK